MGELKSVYELTKFEKKALIKKGEPEFNNQEDKITAINEIIDFMDTMIAQNSKGTSDDDLNTLLMLKLIRYFILEHRDVLEQYELDYDDE